MSHGALAVCGGGEFAHGTQDADGHLLASVAADEAGIHLPAESRPDRAFMDAASAHFDAIGVRWRLVSSPGDLAGLRYLHIADHAPDLCAATLRGSEMWEAMVTAWRDGAALTASGGAAEALGRWIAVAEGSPVEGLGLIPATALIARSDSLPAALRRELLAGLPEGCTAVGLDDQTSAIWEGGQWRAWGPGTVNVFVDDGERDYGPGDVVTEIPPPSVT